MRNRLSRQCLSRGSILPKWCISAWRLLGQLHFEPSSIKMGSHKVAHDAVSSQAVRGRSTPHEDFTSKAVYAVLGAHFTALTRAKPCVDVLSNSLCKTWPRVLLPLRSFVKLQNTFLSFLSQRKISVKVVVILFHFQSLSFLPFTAKMFGKPSSSEPSYVRSIVPGAKVGKANGLTLLLDTETFDYSYHHYASEGFKVAVLHHLDQPLMSVKVGITCAS